MMKAIWKYRLNEPGRISKILVPPGAVFRHLDMQSGKFCMWAEVILHCQADEERKFILLGTGAPFRNNHKYCATVQEDDGHVWHLFEVMADD